MSTHIGPARFSQFPGRAKPRIPSIVIPTLTHADEAVLGHSLTNTRTPISPISIPPHMTPTLTSWVDSLDNSPPEKLVAINVASPDVIAIAELFAAMKCTLGVLGTTFDSIGKQSQKMASLAPVIKAAEQINSLRADLQDQIKRQEASMQAVSILLENAVKSSVIDRLKEQIFGEIEGIIANELKGRVQRELAIRIPTRLCQQVHHHTKQELEVQNSPYDFGTHHNSNLQSIEPLRPLLRPLPTPQQSPTYVAKRTLPLATPLDPSPLSAFPRLKVPAPTPTVTSSHFLLIPGGGSQYIQVTPPTPSPVFPRDLKSPFAFGSDADRCLLNDNDIGGKDEYSPGNDDPRPKAAPMGLIPDPLLEAPFDPDVDDSYAQNIHRFMFRIGVCSPSAPSSQVMERPKLHVVIPGPRLASE